MEANSNNAGNFKLLGKDLFYSYNKAIHLTTKKEYLYRKFSDEEKRENIEEKIIKTESNNLINFQKENDLIFWELCNGGNLDSLFKYIHYENSLSEFHIQQIIKKIIKGLKDLDKNKKVLGGISLKNLFLDIKRDEKDEKGFNKGLNKKYYDKFVDDENSITYDIKIKYFISSYERKQALNIKNDINDNLTKYYMAPEILNDPDNNINPTSANIWSLGIITYQLLTGIKAPFKAENNKSIIKNIKKGEISIPANLCPSLSVIRFITSLLKIKPSERPSLEEVKNHEFLKGKPENFDFINIKLLSPNNDNLILNINEYEPIDTYLINTRLESKIKKRKLSKEELDAYISGLNNTLKQLDEEKRKCSIQEIEFFQKEIFRTKKLLDNYIKERENLESNKA